MSTLRAGLDAYFQLVLTGSPARCITVDGPPASGKLTITKTASQDFAARHGNAQVLVIPRAGTLADEPQGIELAHAVIRTLQEPGFHLVAIVDEAERIAAARLRRAIQVLRSPNGNLTLILVGQDLLQDLGNQAA